MNPLDLTGPEFLRFYVPYGLCVVVLAWLIRLLLDRLSGPVPSARWTPGTYPRESDAYAIALLRGDRQEAVRTVLGRLVSAGLVNVEDRLVRALPGAGGRAQLQPIEEKALRALKPGEALRAGKAERRIQEAIKEHLREIEDELGREGLLPQGERKTVYWVLAVATWLAVSGLGLAKIGVAISRGRLNIGFLVLILIGFNLLMTRLLLPRLRARAGQQYLDWLRESHRGLAEMIDSGRRNSDGEIVLAAGIFGLAAVPGLKPLGYAFQPPPSTRRSDGSSSSSSSSGCGSGSSCGGGGCGGGGCGGCGG